MPRYLCFVATLLVVVVTGAGRADTLWYNGDFDQSLPLKGLLNIKNTGAASLNARVYDDFEVSGSGWNVTDVYANVLAQTQDTALFLGAEYEIRSGVSTGKGGTLVPNVTGTTATYVPTTRTYGSSYEYTIRISGLNLSLVEGTYWLMVRPVTDELETYVTATSGAYAVGNPAGPNGNSFSTNTPDSFFSLVEGTADFSMGIEGTSSVVPAPSAFVGLVGMGLMGLLVGLRRRFKR